MPLHQIFPDGADGFCLLRILVVDDDRFQIELLRDMLLTLGVRPGFLQTARSGSDALRQLESGKMPDLLVCDLHMPAMDGFQFMESVADLGFENNLLIISGQSGQVRYSAGLVAQLRRLNYLGALEKPVSMSALENILSEAMNFRNSQRQSELVPGAVSG